MRTAYEVDAVRAAESTVMQVVDPVALMHTAAHELYGVAREMLTTLTAGVAGRRVITLVGSGNNGGDALFASAELVRRGAAVTAVQLSDRIHEAGVLAFRRAGGTVVPAAEFHPGAADLVIDGIVGIGAQGPLQPTAAAVVTALASIPVLAVDIPSGIDPDTGGVADADRVVHAAATVTFGCLKPGHLLPPGRDCCGAVVVADIGLGAALADIPSTAAVLDVSDVAAVFAPMGEDDYKYSHGVLGVAAGSPKYPGAAHMVTGAARHAGVGMVRLFGEPEVVQPVIQQFPDTVTAGQVPARESKITGWVIGPGFGTGTDQQDVFSQLLETDLPLLIDADALTMVAEHDPLRAAVQGRRPVTVVTPHVGELRRMGLGSDQDRISQARQAAGDLQSIVVFKGPGTVIADPGGGVFVDQMGTSVLATAGTGDVLSGLIGATVARHPQDPLKAVAAAVYLHGLAGRIAGRDGRPVTAWDVVAAVPDAVAAIRQ